MVWCSQVIDWNGCFRFVVAVVASAAAAATEMILLACDGDSAGFAHMLSLGRRR